MLTWSLRRALPGLRQHLLSNYRVMRTRPIRDMMTVPVADPLLR